MMKMEWKTEVGNVSWKYYRKQKCGNVGGKLQWVLEKKGGNVMVEYVKVEM